MSQALLELRDIHRTFVMGEVEVPVLNGVSLKIERSEFVSLMGPSGSGKTTLLNLLGCLDRPTSGEYWLDGEETSRMSGDERARLRNAKIGFVFQTFNLLPRTTALQQVMMPLDYAPTPPSPKEARAIAEELLNRVGLGARMGHTPGQLSGGQQQRVAIARALVRRPPVLFADEPTGNLDSKSAAEIVEMLKQLHRDEGITIVLVTHDAQIGQAADRMIRMRDGLIESDSPTSVTEPARSIAP